MMYVEDFVQLVRRHQAPNAILHFLSGRFGPEGVVSIVDYGYPRRIPPRVQHAQDLSSDDLWAIFAFIGNVTTFNGEIPLGSSTRVRVERNKYTGGSELKERPYRGVKHMLKLLLLRGCIVPGHELDKYVDMSRRYCTPENRIHYVSSS